uniref:Elicitin-like protein n=1 Tax=Phytophthora ramorum TaxID=164328 RepID=H3HDQ2_PHYRM
MTTTSMLSLLLLFLVAQVRASGSDSSFGASEPPTVGTEVNATANTTASTPSTSASSDSTSPEETLAPIDTASSISSTFQLVDSVDCNSTVSSTIYVIYNKNRALFDVCVSDAQYQIFPFLGTKPSTAQVEDMASSTSCIAVFTGVLLADFPQCTISGFPLKAAVETLLKIHVDQVNGWAALPTAERFQEMMSWRRCVNLAKEAGVPYDSDSELYAEYEENLDIARSNSSIRVLSNYQVEYQLASGSWYDADGEDDEVVGSTGSDDTAGTVSAGDGSSEVSDSEASSAEENSTAAGNAAPSVAAHGVATAITGFLLSVFLMTA